MQRETDSATGPAPACGCTETHVRSRKLAFLRVDTPADDIAAEKIADGVRDVARGLSILEDYFSQARDEKDAVGLLIVLRERLECEVEALDTLLSMHVMAEDTGPEKPAAGEPNLSLRLAPEVTHG